MASDRHLDIWLVTVAVAFIFCLTSPIRASDLFDNFYSIGPVNRSDAQSPSSSPNQHWQLLHLPGIGGERMIDQYFVRGVVLGLQSSHVQIESRIYDWTEDEDGLLALSDQKLHVRQSELIARLIKQIRLAHPTDFFLLTSHSGGAGMAAWAMQQLPANVCIDEWIMLAPAVSPFFDFTDSFAHVRDRILSFNSETDLVLGTGTRLFGTVDRVNTDAGGRVGFSRPLFGDPLQYAKLRNIRYDPLWLRYGNSGDHIGTMLSLFSRLIVAPTAMTEQLTVGHLPATMPVRR